MSVTSIAFASYIGLMHYRMVATLLSGSFQALKVLRWLFRSIFYIQIRTNPEQLNPTCIHILLLSGRV